MCSVTGKLEATEGTKDPIVMINKGILGAFYLKYSKRNLFDQSLAIQLVYSSPRVPIDQSFTACC